MSNDRCNGQDGTTAFTKLQRVPISSRQRSGLWRYFLIYTGPITHTHFVQIAEPSRVTVRQPSPQRTSLAVISKYTQTTLIPPLRSLCTVSLSPPPFSFFFFFAGNWLQRKGCKKPVTQVWCKQMASFSVSMHFLSVHFQCPIM